MISVKMGKSLIFPALLWIRIVLKIPLIRFFSQKPFAETWYSKSIKKTFCEFIKLCCEQFNISLHRFHFFQGWYEREDAKRFFRLRYFFQCWQETPKSVFFCGKSNSNYEQQSQGTKEYDFSIEISGVFLQRQILNINYHVKCSSDNSQ